MRKMTGIGVLAMCATIACGQQGLYYKTVISGDELLGAEGTFPKFHADSVTSRQIVEASEKRIAVSVSASKRGDAPGQKQYDVVIDGTVLSVTLTNDIVVAMSRNGKDIGVEVPELSLRGNADWIALSLYYHAEALKLLPFTHFVGINEPMETNETSVVCKNVAPRTFNFVCERSRRFRQIHYYHDSKIRRVFESKNEKYDALMSLRDGVGNKSAGWSMVFNANFDEETGCLDKFVCDDFFATFYPNGGLKSLTLFDPDTRKGFREQAWNEKGRLTHDRDLKKTPYPPFNPTNIVIRK